MTKTPWTIAALHAAAEDDLRQPELTASERAHCGGVNSLEIRRLADSTAARRALTSNEEAIARRYGYRPRREADAIDAALYAEIVKRYGTDGAKLQSVLSATGFCAREGTRKMPA